MGGGMKVEALKSASIGLEQFRSMVNYVNTTNKGSVRAIMGANGQVKLEKINNKIGFAPHFTNLSVEHNKALRGRMVDALYTDLKYMPKTSRKDILKAITKCSDDAFNDKGYLKDFASADVSGNRLLRTEVREALRLYDAQFNTPEGRRGIIDRMYIDLVKDFIDITGDETQDAQSAKKYIKENLRLNLDELITSAQLEGTDSLTFRYDLECVKQKIGEAVAAHESFNEIYTTLAQNLISRGEIFDYTLNTELVPGSDDYNLFTDLFNKLGADKLGIGGISKEDRELLNLHASNRVGSQKTVQTYIRYVLGNRLSDIMSKVEPEKLKRLKELVSENGDKGKNLKALKNELESTLNLYRGIVDDALSFCRKCREFKAAWLNEDIKIKADCSDIEEKMEGNTGQVLLAFNMGQDIGKKILDEIEKSGDYTFTKAEKLALKNDIAAEKWNNLFLALERHFASVYNLEQFEINNGKGVKEELKQVWDDRSSEIMTACVEQAKNGGVGTLSNDIQDYVDSEIKRTFKEKHIPDNTPNFKMAYNLVYTYVMSEMCNDKATVAKMLAEKGDAAKERAALFITNVTGLVTRLLDKVDDKGQKELAKLDVTLARLVKDEKLKEADAKKILADFAKDCKQQIYESLITFLSGVRINPDDSLVKVLSQGRQRVFGDGLLEFFGLNNYEKDELTPKLEELFKGALRQATLNAQYATIQVRIQDDDINVANWTDRAIGKVKINDSFLATLFASEADYRKTLVGHWMNNAFKRHFCDAMKSNKLFSQKELVTTINREVLAKAMSDFDKMAVKTFKEFDTFQTFLLDELKKTLAEGLKETILQRNPMAEKKEVEELAKTLINDAIISGRETICRELEQALVDGNGSFPKVGDEMFNGMVDRIGLGIFGKATTSLKTRGEKIISVIDAPTFKSTSIDEAVKTLLANPQCAKVLEKLSKEEAERVVRAVVAPNYTKTIEDIRRIPAALTLGKELSLEDKVAQYVKDRLTDAKQLERLEKFVTLRAQFEQFLDTSDGQALNNPEKLLGAHFNLICEEVIFEELPQMLDKTTDAGMVVGLLKIKTEERVRKVAASFDEALSRFQKRFDSSDGKYADALAKRLNNLIDTALGGDENVPDLVARRKGKYPAFDALVYGLTLKLLTGAEQGNGLLKKNVFTVLVKVMLDDFIDIQKQVLFDGDVSEMKQREAALSGRSETKLEMKFYQSVDNMLDQMSDDEIFARLDDMLESAVSKADKLLDETLSIDGLLADLAKRLEETKEGENTGLTPEMKTLLLEDVRAAVKLNEANRERRAQANREIAEIETDLEKSNSYIASESTAKMVFVLRKELAKLEASVPQDEKAIAAKQAELEASLKGDFDKTDLDERFEAVLDLDKCDMLERMRSFIDGKWENGDDYREWSEVKAKAVNLAFSYWTGEVSQSDADNPDAARIIEYRKMLQSELIDRLATELRVENFGQNVDLVMGYVRDQLTFKKIDSEMSDSVVKIITDQLTKIGDDAADAIGGALNDEFNDCLDGVKTLSDLKTHIDSLLWLSGRKFLFEKYQSIVEMPKIRGIANELIGEAMKRSGWQHDNGIRSRAGKRLENELLRQFVEDVTSLVHVAIMEATGLLDKGSRGGASGAFEDTRKNFILMLSDPVAFEQVCREKISVKVNECIARTQGQLEVCSALETISRDYFPEVIPALMRRAQSSKVPSEAEMRHVEWVSSLFAGIGIAPDKETKLTDDKGNVIIDFAKKGPVMFDMFSDEWSNFFILQVKNDYGINLLDGTHRKILDRLDNCVSTFMKLGKILDDNMNFNKKMYEKISGNTQRGYVYDAIMHLILNDIDTKKNDIKTKNADDISMSLKSKVDGKKSITRKDLDNVGKELMSIMNEISKLAAKRRGK